VGGAKQTLTGRADSGEEDLAGVAVVIGDGGGGWGSGATGSGVADLDAGLWLFAGWGGML